ncbi:MAG TPA: hypothetical protein VK031_00505 [Tissierellaceae bacterium]|nr:hypothetical protein [Tissierellaceae bacterium]
MSELSDTLVRAYSLLLDKPNISHQRALHALIRKICSDNDTRLKIKQVRAMKRSRPIFKNKEVIPNFGGSKDVSDTVVKVEKQTKDDLVTDQILELIEDGEEALIAEFGSVEAFRLYVEDRYDIDFGRKTAFKSVSDTFKEQVQGVEEEEEDNIDEDVFE